jgi:hypothetical protein
MSVPPPYDPAILALVASRTTVSCVGKSEGSSVVVAIHRGGAVLSSVIRRGERRGGIIHKNKLWGLLGAITGCCRSGD